jgi:hypothetical protein
MHWQTYYRFRRLHDAAEERSTIGLTAFLQRLGHRSRRMKIAKHCMNQKERGISDE